jgi:hypothetical protein
MNTTKRQRLVSAMSDERTRGLGVVLKCGVCLALLTLLVAIGVGNGTDGDRANARRNVPLAAPAAKLTTAAAHRKEVFDERRARFTGNASERPVDETAAVAPAEAYVP